MESTPSGNGTTQMKESDIPETLIIVTIVIGGIVACIGALGNTLVIIAIILHKKLRNVHNVFIINLAVADLMINIAVDPFNIYGAIHEGALFFRYHFLCEGLATINVISCVASICSIVNIAVERYVFICHNNTYCKIYKGVKIPIIVASIWLYSFLVDFPNFKLIGWGGHIFDNAVRSCIFDKVKANESGQAWYVFSLAWFIPVVAISYCYISIYLFVRRKSRFRSGLQTPESSTRIRSVDKRVLRVVLAVMIAFITMWSPYIVAITLSGYILVPSWLIFVVSYIALTNSSVNFMIYAFSRDFRDGYKIVTNKIRKKICSQKWQPKRENSRKVQDQQVAIIGAKSTKLTPINGEPSIEHQNIECSA